MTRRSVTYFPDKLQKLQVKLADEYERANRVKHDTCPMRFPELLLLPYVCTASALKPFALRGPGAGGAARQVP